MGFAQLDPKVWIITMDSSHGLIDLKPSPIFTDEIAMSGVNTHLFQILPGRFPRLIGKLVARRVHPLKQSVDERIILVKVNRPTGCLQPGRDATQRRSDGGVGTGDEEQEAIRNLTRVCDDLKAQERKARQQLNAYVLRHGHAWPSNKTRWTKTHYAWLESLKFAYDWQQVVLQEYIDAVKAGEPTGRRHHRPDGTRAAAVVASAGGGFAGRPARHRQAGGDCLAGGAGRYQPF